MGETEKIRFIIGTQSLKQINNQIHLLEFNEEISTIKTTVLHHPDGEIWKITTSPLDPLKMSTCYNSVSSESSCVMKTSIFKLPEVENNETIENLEVITKFDTSTFGTDIKTTEFHPNDSSRAVSVTDNQIVMWDISESNAKSIINISLEGKNNPKFTNGKWNPHQNCNQVSFTYTS